MAKKGGAITVKMQSTESSYFYVTKRNPRAPKLGTKEGKKEVKGIKKYDPKLKKHTYFIETKLK
jgi:ribosomal protein L33